MKKKIERMPKRWFYFTVLSLVFTSFTASTLMAKRPPKPEPVKELRPGLLMGYLPTRVIMGEIMELIPAPPEEQSAAYLLDRKVNSKSMAQRGTARWKQATIDADLHFPDAAGIFSCAIDAPVTEKETPYLYQLLRRTLTDAGLSTYGAKDKYKRPRPFIVNKQPICSPEIQEKLGKQGSYPSGHTAIGWAWALILTEIAPDRSTEILARGRSFGESRLVCNVHWLSDVMEGRFAASATVAKLHGDPAFLNDLQAAKEEYTAIVAKGLKPSRDCKAEAAALAE